MPILESAVSFLSSPTGILLYYLVLLLTLEVTIGLCWGEWRRSRNTRYRHLLLGFGGLLAAKLLVAFGEGLRLLHWLPAPAFSLLFPPLSQAIETAGIVFLCWAFLPSEFKVRRTRYVLLWGSLGVTAGLYVISQSILGLWSASAAGSAPAAAAQYWAGRLWFLWQALLCAGLALVYLWQAGRRRAIIAVGFATLAVGRLLELVALYPLPMPLTMPPLWEHVSNVIALPLFAVVIYQVTVARLYRYNRELQDLSQESQRQVRDLFFLLETVKATTAFLDVQLTYNQVVENIALAMRADHCALALRDPGDPRHVQLVAAYDVLTRERLSKGFPIDLTHQKVLEVVVKRDRQVLIEEVETDPQLKALYQQMRGGIVGPALFQTIAVSNRVLGVLLLAKEPGQTFTAEERVFCKNLVKQIAAALENIRVFAASRQEVQRATDLRDVTQALGSSLDLKHILDTVLVLAQRKIGYDMAEISLLDADGHVTWIRGARERVYGRSAPGQEVPAGPARWIVEHRQPLLIAQVNDPLPPRPEWADVPITSFLGAPLRYHENLLGVIELARIRGTPFTEAHQQFLTHLTHAAAEALERALAYHAMSQQLERGQNEMQALQAAYAAIHSPTSLPEALDTILDEALRATRSPCGTLVVLSEQEEEGLAHQLFRGLSAARETLWRRLGVAGSALTRAIREGEPLYLPDVTAVPEFRPLAEEGHAQLVVPLPASAGLSGGLIVESPQANAYDTADLALVKGLADAAALALVQDRLQRKRATEQTDQRIWELDQANQSLLQHQAQLQHLLSVRRSLTSSMDLTVSLAQTLPLVLDALSPPFSGATVLLFDAGMNSLLPQVTVGYRARPFKLDEGLAWQAMAQQQVLQVAEPGGSAVALPLLAADEFLGVLLLASPGRRLLDRDELDYLATMAQDMAEAISNARLYQGLGQQVERLVALLQAQTAGPASDQMRPVLDNLPVGILIADANGTVTWHNHLAQRLLDRTDLLEQNIHTLCGWTDAAGELRPEAAPLLEFQSVRQQLERETNVLDAHLSPMLSAEGTLLGYLAMLRDVTEEVRRARQHGESLGALAHQLYEPLTSISGYLDLVLTGDAGSLTDPAREYLRVAQDNCARMAQLLGSLLKRGAAAEPSPVPEVTRAPTPEGPEPAARAARVPHRILVVDDEPDIARLVKHYLEPEGYAVTLAPDGPSALESARRDRPDLILLDLFMPEMDGYTVIQQLRTNPATASIPVIVMSVLANDTDKTHLGAVAYVHKPLHRQHLLAAVNQVLLRVEQVLVISQDESLTAELTNRLQAQGYPVQVARDDRQALGLANQPDVRLLVVDMRAPGGLGRSGEALLDRLRQRSEAPPAVVLVDREDREQEERLLAQGAHAVIAGPIEPARLAERIKSWTAVTTYYRDLVRAAGADDPYLRWRAVETLSQAPRDEVLGYLLAAVRDQNPYVRLNAVEVLSRLGDRRAMLPLIGCLADEDPRLVSRAAEALGQLGDPRAVEPLIAHLKNSEALVRSKIVEALGTLGVGDQRVVSRLTDTLADRDARVQWGAVQALGQFDSANVIESLLRTLQDEDAGVRSRAAVALGMVAGRGGKGPSSERWGEFSQAVIEGLIAALEDPVVDVRERAVEALGLLGDERAIFPLRRLVTEREQPGAVLPELARLAIRQIRERGRTRGRQWDGAEDQRQVKRQA